MSDNKLINYKHDTFTFGRYKGEPLEEIDNIKYLKWAIDNLDARHPDTEIFIKNIESLVEELER
jgi:hypothetical protein